MVEQAYQLFAELSQLRTDAAVARPVSKAEAAVNHDAREARPNRIGFAVLALGMKRNSEFPAGHKDRKHEGRVVFDGSGVRDPNREAALFQELSSSPVTMQASKAAYTLGKFEGRDTQRAEAKQACTQSKLGGTPTW
eukprot:8624598-Pyramimonas_sp.AAC.1